MLDVDEVYGLLVMDRKEATMGVLEGKQIKVLRSLTSHVPGKYKAGGQSAQRFERIREGMAKEFFKEVADNMKELFFDMPKLKGILIGGPIPTKEDFLKEGELVTKLKNMVIAVKDIGYTDEHGLEILVEESKKDIAEQEMVKEKEILTKFFETLGKNREKAVYGYEKTKIALERNAVDILLVSKKFDKEKTAEFEKLAEQSGCEMMIISTDNQDGEQFNNLTKGVGALLRYQFE
jgi:peptide chain release factor subunit 1